MSFGGCRIAGTVALVAGLSACATPARCIAQAELNTASLACGLTYGELIQDAEEKKLAHHVPRRADA